MPALAPAFPGATAPTAVAFGPYRVPDDVDLLYRGDAVVALEPRAVQLLRYLAARPGQVVAKRELLDGVWSHQFVTDDVLKQAVAKVRRALGPRPGGGAWVETFHARGYRFAPSPPPDDTPAPDPRKLADAADAADVAEALAALRRAADAVTALAARVAVSLAARTSPSSPRAPS